MYDDDDSASSYTYLKILFYAQDQGWLKPETTIYDPFWGSGSLACLTQLLPPRRTVGTELLLCTDGGRPGGWYMEVDKNLRLFNQSVLATFKSLFAPLGLPTEHASSLFGDVLYAQSDAREALDKDSFYLFSQAKHQVYPADAPSNILPEQHVVQEPFRLQEQTVRFMMANPPWGISTTTLHQNDLEAFTCFFREMFPKLERVLPSDHSGLVLHIPQYWVQVLLRLEQVDTAPAFVDLVLAQRAQDPLLNAQLTRSHKKNQPKAGSR